MAARRGKIPAQLLAEHEEQVAKKADIIRTPDQQTSYRRLGTIFGRNELPADSGQRTKRPIGVKTPMRLSTGRVSVRPADPCDQRIAERDLFARLGVLKIAPEHIAEFVTSGRRTDRAE